MKTNRLLSLAIVLAFLSSCSAPQNNDAEKVEDQSETKLAIVEPDWIANRVAKAQSRMEASDAGRKLWTSIEAHGGLKTWFENGPIAFHFDYQPLGGGVRRNSLQIVDQWSVRSVHEVVDNPSYKYGWDGQNAWVYPDTADVGVNPRFWSTTPFYFIGLPFVLADEGVILEELGKKEYKGITYDLVMATYESGVGDAPDDFYVIYVHPETKLMGALRYIVSYPGFFPDGGHLPEKFMEITGHQTSKGITIPVGYNTFWFKDDEPAEHITKIDIPKFSFVPEISDDYFDAPDGARIQEGL